MVQEADIELQPDAYLTIVYGKDRDKVKMKQFDTKVKNSSKNLLNTPLKSKVASVFLAGFTSTVGQNLAGKALSNAALGRVNSSLYDILADGKVSVKEVAEDFIGSCTNTIDNVATDMGFPTPSSLYTAIMPNGTGVISKDIANLLGKRMDKENKQADELANQGDVTVLKFKIVTSDKETWSMDIPTRKTEKGFEIATSITNHNKTKDFDILLCTDSRAGTDMYDQKNQLEQIRDEKVPFDVYITDKDVYGQYKLTNCLFSNLDFSPNGKNTLNCSLSVVEVPEWDVQIVKLDSTYKGKYSTTKGQNANGSSNKGNGSKKSGISKVVKSAASVAKTTSSAVSSPKNPTKITPEIKKWIKSMSSKGDSVDSIVKQCQKRGVTISRNSLVLILSEGMSISAKK